MQLRTLAHHQRERILNLEQALDESLMSLREVRHQLLDQTFLEHHLAATEETANVQQQVIRHLKGQLALLQQTAQDPVPEGAVSVGVVPVSELPVTGLPADWVPDLSRELPNWLGAQQQRMAMLEAESLSARVFAASLGVWLTQALAEVRELAQRLTIIAPALGDRPPFLHQLESRLQQALQHTQAALNRHPETVASALETEIAALPQAALADDPATTSDLDSAQAKVEELETEIARQMHVQTLLQHANRELELEREQQQTRVAELEYRTADLQEEILQQAQQATEYQTAVQHWKDRYDMQRHQVQRLIVWLTAVLPHPPADIAELVTQLQQPSPEVTIEPGSAELFVSSAQNQSSKLDLPDFLMRRRSYKTRRSS
jgi:hypothetical protein